MPPPLLGTDEDKRREVEAIDFLPIVPVVRLTMNINRLRAFKKTLEETIEIYERQESALEEAETDTGPEG